MTRLRIAMISEHASPLAMLGGVDAGGQNAHVAELASALARRGHEIRVYTRRDARDAPATVPMGEGVLVEHVPAGPAKPIAKDGLLPYMGKFGRWLATQWQTGDFTPDVVHAAARSDRPCPAGTRPGDASRLQVVRRLGRLAWLCAFPKSPALAPAGATLFQSWRRS